MILSKAEFDDLCYQADIVRDMCDLMGVPSTLLVDSCGKLIKRQEKLEERLAKLQAELEKLRAL